MTRNQPDEIALQVQEDDITTSAMMHLVEESGSLNFWHEAGEDIYSAKD